MIADRSFIRNVLLGTGTVALLSGAWMSYSFGAAMTKAHGLTLALLTFVAAVGFAAIEHLKADGVPRWKLNALASVTCIFMAAEFFSHIGYTVGTRVENTEMTGVQNVKYEDSREMVADNKTNLKMWTDRLAQLTSENKWAATVTAEALRAKLPALELAIAQESKRGGCGPICLQRTRERDDVAAQIAIAEEKADLTKKIEATQRKVDGYREKAASTAYVSSPIVNQTKFVSQIAMLSIEPGKDAMTWTQIAIGFLIAMVTTFLPAYCFYLVFGQAICGSQSSETGATTGFVRGKAPGTTTNHKTEVHNHYVTGLVARDAGTGMMTPVTLKTAATA